MVEPLERELRALGRELAFPPAPDVSARVAERLQAVPAPARPRLLPRRPLAIALAVLLVGVVAALAVPPVRGALADLLGIGGVSVQQVDRLPAVAPSTDLALGRRVTLDEARRSVDFPVRVPSDPALGPPHAVYLTRSIPGGAVSLLYGTERGVRLLVTQFRGSVEPDLVKKITAGGETSMEPLIVRGRFGYFLSGRPHFVAFRDANGQIREDSFRLARNVLLWVEDGITFRLETGAGRARALELARSLR